MEVVVPLQTTDFDFNNSVRSSPYASAPSTPRRIGDYYFSAPTSPSRLTDFYREFDDHFLTPNSGGYSAATVPFDWEEKPGTPKSISPRGNKYEDDFAFDVSGEFDRNSLTSAEELFDGGKIKLSKPPPRLQIPTTTTTDDENEFLLQKNHQALISPRSYQSPTSQGKKIIRGALSPRSKEESDPTRMRTPEWERGRERVSSLPSSTSRRTRSLSPLRVSEYPWEEDRTKQSNKPAPLANSNSDSATTSSAALCASSSKGSSRKWRLKDLFLFRSASDGRAMDRDPLKKYTALFRKQEEGFRNTSLRRIENPGTAGSGSRRRGPVSAHELHYTANRAVSNDMKKKTFLPYKQGILGRLAFNPTVHALSNGFGFSRN